MNTNTMARTSSATWLRHAALGLAVVLILVAIGGGVVRMRQLAAGETLGARLASPEASAARARYETLKDRQLDAGQAHGETRARAPASPAARERYQAFKDSQLEAQETGQGTRTGSTTLSARERYLQLKEQQLARHRDGQ